MADGCISGRHTLKLKLLMATEWKTENKFIRYNFGIITYSFKVYSKMQLFTNITSYAHIFYKYIKNLDVYPFFVIFFIHMSSPYTEFKIIKMSSFQMFVFIQNVQIQSKKNWV